MEKNRYNSRSGMQKYLDAKFDAETTITLPLKSQKRGERLTTNQKLKVQRKEWSSPRYFTEKERVARAARALHTPKVCSCWMCGNPRKTEGASIQERRCSTIAEELQYEAPQA